MKKIFALIAFVCSMTICSNLFAQQTPPPGAGDKDMRDTNVKARSIELERIDREARKNGKPTVNPFAAIAEEKLTVKFAEIKTDYEQIQLSQDAVIKAYKSGAKIDYAQISKSALEINKSASRLNSNLFPLPAVENGDAKKEEKKKDKTEKETKPAKSVRDLIIDLDNTIGSFVTSPMFQNLKVIDKDVYKKAKLDSEKIIELSALLDTEARKMTMTGK